MPGPSTATELTQAERVAEQIKQHKEEVARLREEIGDPMEALSAFVRDHFSYEAFFPDSPSTAEPWEPWDGEDDDLSAR